ncbi:MAG: EAL domain-containing protein, partial [Azonexus sp.]
IAFEVQEGITITDAAMVILRVNRAFTEITGYNTEEIVGKTPALLSSGRHDAAFFAAMWESIARTGAWQGEIWNRRKCGEIYPAWLMITAVKDKAGTVTNYVGTFADITARKAAEEEINSLAFFDPLTGLPNRRLLLDRLKQALASSTRNVKYGALLFIDLDHFKNLNDTRGHDIGDLLLQQVAERLTTCVRESDTVARLGGDEFVVMLEDLSGTIQEAVNQAESVGEKILSTLNKTYALGSGEHHSTPSIGIALFADHSEGIDELLKRADLAMYEAKAAGRNTLRFFEPEMQTIVTARAAMEIGLREALANGQFFLHYQAQVTDVCGVAGAEALVRWRHPLRGTISPTEFIPLAEETGLIQPLGLWVLETACVQLARWAMQPGMAHLTLAVNVSARQFHQTDFVDQVLVVLERTGANPCRLKLELTESLLVTNIDGVIAKMSALKIIGVGFSLDDFGTGYSSLSYLSRLPLDQLKIDRSFVMNIESNDNAAAICAATISLAHALNLKVVAEGVETEAQRYFLNMVHHCDLIQGYLFSRPLPIDEFEALAASKVDFPDNQAKTLPCAS